MNINERNDTGHVEVGIAESIASLSDVCVFVCAVRNTKRNSSN